MFYALCAWLLCCYVCIAQMQQQELAQMRQREANLTALAAIGPRKKRKILDSPSSSAAAEVTENKIYSPYSLAYPGVAVCNLCSTCYLYGTQNVTHTSKCSIYIDSIKDFFYRNRNVQQSVLLSGNNIRQAKLIWSRAVTDAHVHTAHANLTETCCQSSVLSNI